MRFVSFSADRQVRIQSILIKYAMKLKKSIALSESGFVFNAERGDSFSVNPTGLAIMQWLKEGREPEEIQGRLQEKFVVDETTCEKDLYDFIKMLNQFNLIEV